MASFCGGSKGQAEIEAPKKVKAKIISGAAPV
jgi:hypothetical protein